MSDPEDSPLIAEGIAAAAAAFARRPRGRSPTAQPCPRCRQPFNHWIVDAYHCIIFEQIHRLWLKGKITREKLDKARSKLMEDESHSEAAARDANTVDYLIRRLNEAGCELSPADRLDMEHLRLNRDRDSDKASRRNERLERALERARDEDTRAQTLFETTLIIRHYEMMEKYGRNAVRARRLIAEIVHLEPEQQHQQQEEEERRRLDPPMKKEEEDEDEMETVASVVASVVADLRAARGSRDTVIMVKKEKKEEEEEAGTSVNAVAPAPARRLTAGRPEMTTRRTSRRTQPYPT